MKTTIIEETKEKEIKFPCIAKNKNDGDIVLFCNYCRGTTIYSNTELGIYKERVSIHNSAEWEILDEITIKFES